VLPVVEAAGALAGFCHGRWSPAAIPASLIEGERAMDDQVDVAGGQAQASMVTLPAEVEDSNAGQVGQGLASALVAGVPPSRLT
jgi:hypothetical protein